AAFVVAGAFGPLRRRAQAAIDWRFDRRRYEGLRRVRAFVDDVREGRSEPEGVGAVLAAALRDPSAELLFRLPASEAYADGVAGVVADAPDDGRVVTLGIVLRRLQRSLPREAQILGPALDSAVDEVGRAIEDLRTIAAGVRPPRLDEGLAAALADLARAAPVAVELETTHERLPPQ